MYRQDRSARRRWQQDANSIEARQTETQAIALLERVIPGTFICVTSKMNDKMRISFEQPVIGYEIRAGILLLSLSPERIHLQDDTTKREIREAKRDTEGEMTRRFDLKKFVVQWMPGRAGAASVALHPGCIVDAFEFIKR